MISESGEYLYLFWVLVVNLHLLNSELRVALAVRRELTSEHCEAHLELMQVSACHLDQHVSCIHRDLSRIWVNDGWQWENLSLRVVEDGVLGLILDNMQILLQLLVLFQNLEKLSCVHLLSLLEGAENDVLRGTCLVGDRALHLVVVVGAHRAEGSATANVLVEFILEVDEGVVRL